MKRSQFTIDVSSRLTETYEATRFLGLIQLDKNHGGLPEIPSAQTQREPRPPAVGTGEPQPGLLGADCHTPWW